MSLLSESTPLVKMPGKRLSEESSYQNSKNSPKFKRSNTNSVRTFPLNYGCPFAPKTERTSPGFSGVDMDKISKATTFMDAAMVAKPLRIVAPSEVNYEEYVKPKAVDDSIKVESSREKLSLNKEKFYSAIGSRKLDRDVLLILARDDISKRATSLGLDSPDSGEDYVPFSKIGSLANRKSYLETKLFEFKAEKNEESAGDEDEDDDCIIIEDKSNNVSRRYLVKDQFVSSTLTEKNSSPIVQGQSSRGCNDDDDDVYILCTSEWNNLVQSGFQRHSKSEKDNGAESSVGKIVKPFEIEWVEEITRESVEETDVQDLKNMNIVPYEAATDIVSRDNVQQARRLYNELFKSLLHEYKEELKEKKYSNHVYVEAAMLLKKEHKWVNVERSFGHVPGVEIGDQFQYRAELALVGLHHELMAGINYATIEGNSYAVSVVDSGRYENKVKSPNILVYSGHGGNPKFKAKNLEDQKLEGGNLALKNSMVAKLPVRVIRKTLLGPDATSKKMYIYDGLYTVSRFWPERSESGKLALMFELVRASGQPDCNYLTISKPRRSIESLDNSKAVATYDVSQGKEKTPIMVVNEVNSEKPAPFTYTTKMMYPHWYELSVTGGCFCIDGCSDSVSCPCSVKNKGELPFNEEGAIVKAKPMVHECGPNCKCPPSCQNRVSQHGPRFPLEVFRTKSTGWGVRSPVEIPSGSFICEYIGELLDDKEADQRTNDEYLFDLDDGNGFTIDAVQYGNVGRFINHSCSPNLYAQNVLYDHNDKKLPHVMLFATKNIPALKELSYDYNYKLDRVCDANGNIKKKKCCCGSRKCTGRMY